MSLLSFSCLCKYFESFKNDFQAVQNLGTGRILTISELSSCKLSLEPFLHSVSVESTPQAKLPKNCPSVLAAMAVLYGPNHRLLAIGRSREYIQTKSQLEIFTKRNIWNRSGWIPAVSGEQMHWEVQLQ